jgi:hypothetical protein
MIYMWIMLILLYLQIIYETDIFDLVYTDISNPVLSIIIQPFKCQFSAVARSLFILNTHNRMERWNVRFVR